jgi:hypothetical protein
VKKIQLTTRWSGPGGSDRIEWILKIEAPELPVTEWAPAAQLAAVRQRCRKPSIACELFAGARGYSPLSRQRAVDIPWRNQNVENARRAYDFGDVDRDFRLCSWS